YNNRSIPRRAKTPPRCGGVFKHKQESESFACPEAECLEYFPHPVLELEAEADPVQCFRMVDADHAQVAEHIFIFLGRLSLCDGEVRHERVLGFAIEIPCVEVFVEVW